MLASADAIFRRYQWLQWNGICVWADRKWQDFHHDGTFYAYSGPSRNSCAIQGADIDSPELKGLIPRITEQIFQSIVESDAHLEYVVKVSYMEIYLERIRDLLARSSTELSTFISASQPPCSPE